MSNSSNDKTLPQNNDKYPSLVEYSSSSEDEDEDESPARLGKKRDGDDMAHDASLSGDGSSDFDFETEEALFGEDDDSDNDFWYTSDTDFLNEIPVNWRAVDKWNLPEPYSVVLAGKCPRDKSRCLELLEEIDCSDRFIGRSVETGRAFYANLNKDEAAKMEALKGVHSVVQARRLVFNIA